MLALLLIEAHPQNAPPVPTGISWLGSIEYLGETVLPGRWMLVACQVRKATLLVQVDSFFSVLGKPYRGSLHLMGHCFTPSTTLKKDTDHMMFARKESLTGGTALVFSFDRLTLTLLTAYIHPESISFAESL